MLAGRMSVPGGAHIHYDTNLAASAADLWPAGPEQLHLANLLIGDVRVARRIRFSTPNGCGNCRAKVAAGRTRCPRCGAVEAASNPQSDAAHSKRLAMISGTLLGAGGRYAGRVYLQQPAETATVIPKSVADLLAARRAASAAAVAAAQEQDSTPADPALREERLCGRRRCKLLDQYRDAVQRRPEDADARTSLAQMLVGLERTEEACRTSSAQLPSTHSGPRIT